MRIHLAVFFPPRFMKKLKPPLPQFRRKILRFHSPDIPASMKRHTLKDFFRARSDARNLSHRKVFEKIEHLAGIDRGQSVRFFHVGGDLRQEHGRRDAGRGRQTGGRKNVLFDQRRKLDGIFKTQKVLGNVEIGFIQRNLFNERRVGVKNRHYGFRRGAVFPEIGMEENAFGTKAPGL